MKSVTTQAFRRLYAKATKERQNKIRRAFRLWILDPNHPSLRFKKVHNSMPIYSARVDLDWRAVGVLKNETMVWFWVGSHQHYEELLKSI